ncbi:MAG: hypothetical protein OXC92_04350 [Flavobacteriaceae bacterium]|nr:hypothetical protein [Flavobacteriaceae bacterium]
MAKNDTAILSVNPKESMGIPRTGPYGTWGKMFHEPRSTGRCVAN